MRFLIPIYSILIFISSCQTKKSNSENPIIENSEEIPYEQSSYGLIMENKPEDTLLLQGKFEIGKSVFLIQKHTGKVYEAQTLSHYIEGENDIYTKINIEDLNFNPIVYLGQSFDDVKVEKVISLKETLMKNQLDSLVRNSVELRTLLKEGFIDEYVDSIKAVSKITIEQFQANSKTIFIATLLLDGEIGPRLLLIENDVLPLTGPYSFNSISVFNKNNRFFIDTGSRLSDDWVKYQLFEILSNSVVLLYENDGAN